MGKQIETRRPDGGDVPVALAPPPGNPRFAGMDGLRGLACISVIWWHSGQEAHAFAGGGWHSWLASLTFGPRVFFVLSGFLLYRPYISARVLGTPKPTPLGFWRKRALRIFPGYWVALTLLALWPGLPGAVLGKDWAYYYGMAHIYSQHTLFGGLGVSWTVCTEAGFYALLPLIAVLGAFAHRRFGTRWARDLEIAALVGVAVASYFWFHHYTAVAVTPRSLWLPAMAAFFAAGMILAHLSVPLPGRPPLRDRIPSWTVVWVACCLLAFGLYVLRMHVSDFSGAWVVEGLFAVAVVAPAVFARPSDRGFTRLLSTRFMTWLGAVSYGTYLYHRATVQVLYDHGIGGSSAGGIAVLCLASSAVALALGTVSYHVVELPMLRLKYGRGGRRSGPAPEPAAESAPAAAPAGP